MEGPICRYQQTAQQLWEAPPLRYQNLMLGLQRMSYGLLKKILVADRLNLFIKTVFDHYEDYDGLVIAVAAVCYTIQLYMDFSGTMDLAVGAGRIFGFHIPENFQRPFFSRSIPEFWQRWHISLGTWFKDYIFYPMSMSKPLKKLTTKARKRLGSHYGPLVAGSIALFCVWLCNGLWHGAAWNYVFFGMYHFALILLGNLTEPLTVRWTGALGISRTSVPYRGFQMVRTGILVCIGELFSGPMDCTTGWLCFIRWSPSFLWHVSAAGACSRWVCGRRIFCSWRFFWLCLCWWESLRSVASTLERACGSRRLCCVWRSTTPSFWL